MANARAKSKTRARVTGKKSGSPKATTTTRSKAATKAAKPAKPAPARSAKVVKVERAPRPERPVERIEIKAPAGANPEAFRLVAIERTEPPAGAAGRNWYRYTIRQNANAIHGYLQGTAVAVKTAAEQIVGQLNERRAGRWGYRTTRAAAPATSA